SGIWITSLRWKSRSAARVTFFVARHPAWRACWSKPAASLCHRRYAHAEPIFSSAQAERKRVTRPFSKLQPVGNERLPPTWCKDEPKGTPRKCRSRPSCCAVTPFRVRDGVSSGVRTIPSDGDTCCGKGGRTRRLAGEFRRHDWGLSCPDTSREKRPSL